MPTTPLPEWLVLLTQSHFSIVCIVVCFISTFFVVICEKSLINSGKFAQNALGLLIIFISNAGVLLVLEIYREAFNLGVGERVPAWATHYIYAVGSVTALAACVLVVRDMKRK